MQGEEQVPLLQLYHAWAVSRAKRSTYVLIGISMSNEVKANAASVLGAMKRKMAPARSEAATSAAETWNVVSSKPL